MHPLAALVFSAAITTSHGEDRHKPLSLVLNKIESQYTTEERRLIRAHEMPLDNERINIGNYVSRLIDEQNSSLTKHFNANGIYHPLVMHDIMMKALWIHLVEGKNVHFSTLVGWGIEKQKQIKGEKSSLPEMRTAATPDEAIKMLTDKSTKHDPKK